MSGGSIPAFMILGAAAGAIHYGAIMLDARQLAHGRGSVSIIGRRVGRFVISGSLFVLAARSGTVPLIAAAASFLALRQWAMRRFGAIQ